MPCEECTQIIKSKGIRYIYYSDKNGEIHREVANDFVSGYTNWLNENVRKPERKARKISESLSFVRSCSSHTEHLPAQEDADRYTNHSDPVVESTTVSYA